MKSSLFKKYVWLTVILIFATGLSTNIFSQDAKDKDPLAPIENLSFQAAEIRSVIRFLADYGNVNVVVAPKVQGQVTINLKNVTWKQALTIIGSTYNLAIVFEEDGYIRVLPSPGQYRRRRDFRIG